MLLPELIPFPPMTPGKVTAPPMPGRPCPGRLTPGMEGFVGRLGFVEPGLLPTFPSPTPGNGNGLIVLGLEGVVGLISIGGLTIGFVLMGGKFGRVEGRVGLAGFVSGRILIPPPGLTDGGSLLLGCPIPMDGRSVPSDGKEGRDGSVDGRLIPGLSLGFDGRTLGILMLGFTTLEPLNGLELPSDGPPVGKLGF
jgi:hypothetical protein